MSSASLCGRRGLDWSLSCYTVAAHARERRPMDVRGVLDTRPGKNGKPKIFLKPGPISRCGFFLQHPSAHDSLVPFAARLSPLPCGYTVPRLWFGIPPAHGWQPNRVRPKARSGSDGRESLLGRRRAHPDRPRVRVSSHVSVRIPPPSHALRSASRGRGSASKPGRADRLVRVTVDHDRRRERQRDG